MDSKQELLQVVNYLHSNQGIMKKDISQQLGITAQQFSNALRSTNLVSCKKMLAAVREAYSSQLFDFKAIEMEQETENSYMELLERMNEEYKTEIERLRTQNNKLIEALIGRIPTD